MFTFPTCGQLHASKTHAARRWSFQPAADDTAPSLGVLTLVQGKRDVDSYGVAVEDGQVLLAKLDGEADVYGVRLDRAGKPVACTCKGFSCSKKPCKHVQAVQEMGAEGLLPVATPPVIVPATIKPSTWRPICAADLQGGF